MTSTGTVPIVSAASIGAIEYLKNIFSYAPEITFCVQLVIGVLTIVYLFKKIKNFKA